MTEALRKHVYLHQRTLKSLEGYNLSGRIIELIDRYNEVVKRTDVRSKFTDREWATIMEACEGWWIETIDVFGGAETEVRDWARENKRSAETIIAKLRALTPGEQMALADAIERHQRDVKAKVP